MATVPTRYPQGVTNVAITDPLSNFGMPDPSSWHVYFDEFDKFNAGEWTITLIEAGSGSVEIGTSATNGGVLKLQTDDALGDSVFLQLPQPSFIPVPGKRFIFKCRMALALETAAPDWIIGLAELSATPLAPNGNGVENGIFFRKDTGNSEIDFYCQLDSLTGQMASPAFALAESAGVFFNLAAVFDGDRSIFLYKDDIKIFTVDLTTSPENFLPGTLLAPLIGVQNGEAVFSHLNLDYFFAAQER